MTTRNRRPYAVAVGLLRNFSFFTLLGATIISAFGLPDGILRVAGVVPAAIACRFVHAPESDAALLLARQMDLNPVLTEAPADRCAEHTTGPYTEAELDNVRHWILESDPAVVVPHLLARVYQLSRGRLLPASPPSAAPSPA